MLVSRDLQDGIIKSENCVIVEVLQIISVLRDFREDLLTKRKCLLELLPFWMMDHQRIIDNVFCTLK